MSISIEKLFKEERDVGKTIKSTKKLYIWKFILNGKSHKVEMFHSKISGKKKLCLDAQVLVQDKGYHSSFTYSFRIDQNYFNIVQLNIDKFEIKIDNQSFDSLIKYEKTGKLKAEKGSAGVVSFHVKRENTHIPKVVPQIKQEESRVFASKDDDFDFSNRNNNKDNVKKNISRTKKESLSTRDINKRDRNLLDNGNLLLDFNQYKPQQVITDDPMQNKNNNYKYENTHLDLHQYDPFAQIQSLPNESSLCHQEYSNNISESNKANIDCVNSQQTQLELLQQQLGNMYAKEYQPSQNQCINLEAPYIEQNELTVNSGMNMQNYPYEMNHQQQQQPYPLKIQNPPSMKTNLNFNVNNYPLNNCANNQLNIQSKNNEAKAFDYFFDGQNDQQLYTDSQLYQHAPTHQTLNQISIINKECQEVNKVNQIDQFFTQKHQDFLPYQGNNSNQTHNNHSTPFDYPFS